MKEIQLTQGYVALVDDADFEFLSQWSWHYQLGYAMSGARLSEGKRHAFMHRLLMNPPKHMQVDHINGNRLDNRRENLRICSHSENQRNRRKSKNNKSGYKGVVKEPRANTWKAQINFQGKTTHIGNYKTAEEAARAYNKRAKELYGEFAKINEGVE